MLLTAPYISCSLSYIHISTLSLFLMSAIWWAPYFAVRNFSLFFSSGSPPRLKFTCLLAAEEEPEPEWWGVPVRLDLRR